MPTPYGMCLLYAYIMASATERCQKEPLMCLLSPHTLCDRMRVASSIQESAR